MRKARGGGVDNPMPVPEFRKEFFAQMDRLKVSRELASRYLNDGFSGGEKKRVEILQMAMLKPKIAVLDETDSGSRHRRAEGRRRRRAGARRPRHGRARDHALPAHPRHICPNLAGGVQQLVGPEMGALVITHYQRILDYITPDFVHVFVDGRIVEEGGPELAIKLETSGYEQWEEVPA